ncbi:hypothetical protein BV898_17671 [Hypsibius exemplaris]|uniref:Transmembrane protein 151B n=1 Tax=Hypsibius exemplaris TaxID=2072580 RepID=A0A9X6NIF6_HYPEX|nr:hypothetical protein BV898_17671 [Hypsibius exemplaris]
MPETTIPLPTISGSLISQQPTATSCFVEIPLPDQLTVTPASRPKAQQGIAKTCSQCCSSCCTWCQLCYLTVIVSLLVVTIVDFKSLSEDEKLRVKITCGVICGVIYLFYLLTSFGAGGNFRYLKAKHASTDVAALINAVKLERPSLYWEMRCYHMAPRSQFAGNVVMYYEEKVETWKGRVYLPYTQWWDTSPAELADLAQYEVTRVKFEKKFEFVDDYTAEVFAQLGHTLEEENKWRDLEFSLQSELTIPGYQEKVLSRSVDRYPIFMNVYCYAIAVIFLLELPFSFMMKKVSGRKKFAFTKVFQCERPKTAELLEAGPSDCETDSDLSLKTGTLQT